MQETHLKHRRRTQSLNPSKVSSPLKQTAMKTHHPKLKTQPRPLFSCGFFRQCTENTVSPTTPNPPSLPLSSTTPPRPPPPAPPSTPPPPLPQQIHSHQKAHQKSTQAESSSSSSSSTTTSQSFTQWRFPLSNSPLHQSKPDPQNEPDPSQNSTFQPNPPPLPPQMLSANLQELLLMAELQLSTGSDHEQLTALYILERSLVPDPPSDPVCSLELMRGVVANLKNKAGAKPATKILLALCLAGANRPVAVEAGAVGTLVEVAMELDGAPAERALAALELTCTVEEGAAELRAHALAVPVMVTMMGKMAGRGKEYAISALAVIYGTSGGGFGKENLHAPPEEVARAVVLALQGDCTARGRRKGAQLLKALQEYGRVDVTQEGNGGP